MEKRPSIATDRTGLLTMPYHLYDAYRDYKRARGPVSDRLGGLPNIPTRCRLEEFKGSPARALGPEHSGEFNGGHRS